MAVLLELPPELESTLSAAAEAEGLPLAAYILARLSTDGTAAPTEPVAAALAAGEASLGGAPPRPAAEVFAAVRARRP